MVSNMPSLVFLVLIIISYFVYQYNASKGKVVDVRRLPAIDAIEESIGRAVEMGRPVHFTTGSSGDLSDASAPMHQAGLAVLDYVARLSSERGAQLVANICKPDIYILAESIVREAYIATGHQEDYKDDTVRFIAGSQFGFASAVMGFFQRNRPAANILIGGFAAESLIYAETASKIGAFQVAGTANPHQIAFFVVASDYALIGEEIYAASAYISKEPELINTLAAQDMAKIISIALILLGVVLLTIGSSSLLNWMQGG